MDFELSKEPLHTRVKRVIRGRINDTHPEFLPSERELQAELGISRTTLRKALAELERERRVMAVHGKGYRVIYRAAGGDLKGLVGIALKTGMGQYETEVFNQVINHVYKSGFKPVVTVIDPRYELVTEKLEALLANVDGALVYTNLLRDEDALALGGSLGRMVGVPYPLGEGGASVFAEMENSYETLTRHLLKQGHRRIAVMVGPGNLDRIRGIERAGLAIDPALRLDTLGHRHCGYENFGALLARRKPFTAVICQNDPCALGVIERCFKEGMKVPEEVSVVGFDNVAGSELYPVPLTTSGIDLARMARQALELLLQAARTGQAGPPTAIDTKLIVRASVARIK